MFKIKPDDAEDYSDKPHELIRNPSLLDIQVGWQMLVTRNFNDFIRTSKITKIIFQTEKQLVFTTETSLYTLTKEDEQNDETID